MEQSIMLAERPVLAATESTESGLAEFFLQQVERYPNRPSIITPEGTLTYAQLAEQAHLLAAHLSQLGVKHEEPVAILLGPSVAQIICQVAIMLAGGTCVPLNPALPDERLNFMLQEAQAHLTITDASLAQRPLTTRFIMAASYPYASSRDIAPFRKRIGLHQRSHILFTSGTTGRPKGVEIEECGIVRMVVNSSYLHLGPGDRIACISNPAFDASLLEVWAALLNGSSLVIITKEKLLDPRQLENALQQYAVSFMLMTTSLFNFMAPRCPNAFRSLNYLLVGGEAFNLHALKAIPPAAWPKKILNSYGPTEGTTITTYYPVVAADLNAGSVPIGWPIENTEVFILDHLLQPVAPGATGEIYIGGKGLARGYINHPELTQEKFIFAKIPGEEQSRRLYKSGDSGWQRLDGAIMYSGRIDSQIKLQGYRIEIEEIEMELMNSGLLLAAIACIVKKEGIEGYLQAFIVPKHRDSFDSGDLLNRLKQHLPHYMLPRLQVIESIPINENGKADRALLLALADKPESPPEIIPNLSKKESDLLRIWQNVLDVQQPSLDDEFFLLGGTSLQAARLVLEIKREFGQRLSIQNLYDAQTPRNLLQLLQQTPERTGNICATLLSDSQLPDDIQPWFQAPQQWLSPSAGHVLLTGATGFMGAFCLRDLLSQADVRQVACLVRAQNNAVAMRRVRENLTKYGLWKEEFSSRIQALAGDLAQTQLGLDQATYQHLAKECDVIFHIAAHISFIEPYQTHRATNVTGSINILRLSADSKAKPLHYVSTIAATGPVGLLFPVSRFYEDGDLMPHLEGMRYTLGYIQSKWVAERLMLQARERGMPVAVYRPGFMMTDSMTGVGNPEDFMWRVIKACINTGAYPVLVGDRKELITVDYASAALISIASDNKRLGRAYHLIPPDDKQSISLIAFFELFEQCGHSLSPLPYKQWLQRLYEDPELDTNPLMPLLPMLSEVVYEGLTVWEVFRNIPRYDSSQTQAALLESHGPEYIPTNAKLLALYLDHMKSIGAL
ncbi:MAG: amino acid adenylation domain-containing protein [Collimonas pratensis]|uniref:non-ribosomal peptide synthetase n=1 Tax=Collimonas pratensis TaxID=279113 RepID=UPI003C7221F8